MDNRTPVLPVYGEPLASDSTHLTLRQQVRHRLLELLAEHYVSDLRLPTTRELASQLGVSSGTINQAVSDLVQEAVLVARPKAGTRIAPGCTREFIQGRLSSSVEQIRKTSVVQVMVPRRMDGMLEEMSEIFARMMVASGVRVETVEYPVGWPFDPVIEGDFDAVALFQPIVSAGVQLSWHGKRPMVVVSTEGANVYASGGFDSVSEDDENGCFLAGQYLREAGAESCCFVGRGQPVHPELLPLERNKEAMKRGGWVDKLTSYVSLAVKRLAAFERGWRAPIPPELQLKTISHDMNAGSMAVADYLDLSPRPEAVFCLCDDLAVGFYHGACAHRLVPGRDFSLMGFDRQESGSVLPFGPLTTVEIPREIMARQAVNLLLDRLRDPSLPARRNLVGCAVFEGTTVAHVETSE